MNVLRKNAQARPSCFFVHFRQIFLIIAYVWLSVGVFQHFDLLQRPSDVLLSNARPATHIRQGIGFVLVLSNEVDQALTPPREICLFT